MGPFLDYLGSEDPGLLKRLLELVEEYRGRGSLFDGLEAKPELREVHDGLCEAWRGYLRALLPTAPEPPVSATLPVGLREQLEMDLGLPSVSKPPPVPEVPSILPEARTRPRRDDTDVKIPWWGRCIIGLVLLITGWATLGVNDTTIVVSNAGNGAVYNVTFHYWRHRHPVLPEYEDQVIAEIGPRSSREFKPPTPDWWSRNARITLQNLAFTDVSGRVYSRRLDRRLFWGGLAETTIRIGDAGDVKVEYWERSWWWRWPAVLIFGLTAVTLLLRLADAPFGRPPL